MWRTLNLSPIPAITLSVPDPAPLGMCLVSWPILAEATGTEAEEAPVALPPLGLVLDAPDALPDIASHAGLVTQSDPTRDIECRATRSQSS